MTREFRLPDRTYLPAIFERLALHEADQHEILAAWPDAETDSEIWRSLERAYQTLVGDLGGFAPLELQMPPVRSSPLGRSCAGSE